MFTDENKENIPVKEKETEARLDSVTITKNRIRKQIQRLRNGAAPGPDGISPRVLKELEELVELLNIIYTRSLREGKVPAGWKQAVVVPIHKKAPKGIRVTIDQSH